MTQSVHEMTVMRELIDQRLEAIAEQIRISDQRQKERVDAVRDTLSVAMDSAERAVQKAEDANNKRFDSINEFRGQLADQATHFITATEYRTAHGALIDKVDIIATQVVSVDATVRNKLPQVISGPTFFIGSASVIIVVVLAVIGGAIQIGALQTRVSVNTDIIAHLVSAEKIISDADTKQQVEVAIIKGRLLTNELMLHRLETRTDNNGSKK